jgi:hypothetical protein
MKLVKAFVNAEERAIIDGDTDGTHQDSDVGASTTDARTAWDGLRKKASPRRSPPRRPHGAQPRRGPQGDGQVGRQPADLAFIIGVSPLRRCSPTRTCSPSTRWGRTPPSSTARSARSSACRSSCPSGCVRPQRLRRLRRHHDHEDGMLCVNRNEWAIGQRMALDVEVDDSIYRETFQRVVVAFQREDFQPSEARRPTRHGHRVQRHAVTAW